MFSDIRVVNHINGLVHEKRNSIANARGGYVFLALTHRYAKFCRKNFLSLDVYYGDLQSQHIQQYEAYPLDKFFSESNIVSIISCHIYHVYKYLHLHTYVTITKIAIHVVQYL